VKKVLDIDDPEVRASLLRLDSDRRERRLTARKCIEKTYDLLAGELVLRGTQLTDQELLHLIPGKVLEVAVKFSWVPDPACRAQRSIRSWFAGFEPKTPVNTSRWVRIPENELTEQLGPFRVTPGYRNNWCGLLGGRIRAWKANALDMPISVEAPPLGPGIRPDPGHKRTKLDSAETLPQRSQATENARHSQDPLLAAPNGDPGKGDAERASGKGDRNLSAKSVRAGRRAILKKYRKKKDLRTMDDLARNLHVSRTALYGMTAGDRTRYSVDALDTVLDRIGCSLTEWNSGLGHNATN
jgi:hypothetical protein